MMQKKKEFGLAAQLAQPRIAAPETVPPASSTPRETAGALPTETTQERGEFEAPSHLIRSDHTNRLDRTSSSSPRQKKPGAPPRAGGYVRRTITLGPALSDYVDRAWRTYRTVDGEYVKGVSGFIEAVIDEHRRRGA
jgi:hypothetical protein